MLDRFSNTAKDILTVRKRLPLVEGPMGEFTNYFRVSPQLHLISVGGWMMGLGLVLSDNEILQALAIGGTAGNCFYNSIKALVNLDSYYRLRHNFEKSGFQHRFLRTNTLCARNVTRLAAIDAGFEEEINQYYQKFNLNKLI
jgi:hypothetical protein